MQDALQTFRDTLDAQPCYLFVCFFVNNQHRIIVEGTTAGSDNLEDVFESNLKRIGKMVAILDTFDRPMYLTRIWTLSSPAVYPLPFFWFKVPLQSSQAKKNGCPYWSIFTGLPRTVYEQYVASTIQIEVQFIMPRAAANHLQQQIACGS